MDDSGQSPSLDSHRNTKTAEPDYSLLSGANATFIAEMKASWVHDPSSVDRSWAAYFKHLHQVGAETDLVETGPSWGRAASRVVGAIDPEESIRAVADGYAGPACECR